MPQKLEKKLPSYMLGYKRSTNMSYNKKFNLTIKKMKKKNRLLFATAFIATIISALTFQKTSEIVYGNIEALTSGEPDYNPEEIQVWEMIFNYEMEEDPIGGFVRANNTPFENADCAWRPNPENLTPYHCVRIVETPYDYYNL